MPTSTDKLSLEAIISILDDAPDFKTLEKRCFNLGMRLAAILFEILLIYMDEELAEARSRMLRNRGFRERTIQTVFGEITIKRRRYEERVCVEGEVKRGSSHYLLDEALGLPPEERTSPGLVEALVEGAVEEPFRRVVERRQGEGLPTPSHVTIHNLTRKLGEMVSREQEAEREAVFEYGEELAGEKREVSSLFLEADGTIVHLQREEEKLGEVKVGLWHEGWERRTPGSEEYTLINPKVISGVFSDGDKFWETEAAQLSKGYDLECEGYIVLNGDGAGWIDGARGYFDGIERQIDRFHLNRDIRRVFRDGEASHLIGLISRGEVEGLIEGVEASVEKAEGAEEKKRRKALLRFLEIHRDAVIDYRLRERRPPEGMLLRGMGAIEPYVDKVIANRMKKRGMRWTIAGADAMARLRGLDANGELLGYVSRRVFWEAKVDSRIVVRVKERVASDPEAWLRKAVPVLYGPHSDRPWVKAIRELLSGREALA